MSVMSEPSFSGEEAAEAQTALREALGLAPERFPVEVFIGMISDEIEQLRARGQDDAAIAQLVSDVTGKLIEPAILTANYALPGSADIMANEAVALVTRSAPIDVYPHSQVEDYQRIGAMLRSVVRQHGMLDGEADYDFIIARKVGQSGTAEWVAAVTSTIPWRANQWVACQNAVDAVCAQYR